MSFRTGPDCAGISWQVDTDLDIEVASDYEGRSMHGRMDGARRLVAYRLRSANHR